MFYIRLLKFGLHSIINNPKNDENTAISPCVAKTAEQEP
jgi:hypothetical protein